MKGDNKMAAGFPPGLLNRKIAAFNLRRAVGLMNSAAYARAARKHTSLSSSRFSDSAVWNTIVSAITGRPGYPEIAQDVRAVDNEQRTIYTSLLISFAASLSSGPRPYLNFMQKIAAERADDLAAVQQVFSQANHVGREIEGNLGSAIRACAAIQLGSTVFLAVTPVGLTFAGASTAAAAGWVGFGYSVTRDLAKDLEEAKHAGIIAFDLSKDVGKKVGDEAAGKVVEAMERKIETQSEIIAAAERTIADLSRSVATKVSSSKIAKLSRKIQGAHATAGAAGRATTAAKIGTVGARALQVVFAAHDVYEGWEDFQKSWNGSL